MRFFQFLFACSALAAAAHNDGR